MHQVEEIPKGGNPNHYFSSLNAVPGKPMTSMFNNNSAGGPQDSGSSSQTTTQAGHHSHQHKRKRVNYNIQEIQAQQLRLASASNNNKKKKSNANDTGTNDGAGNGDNDIEEISAEESLLSQIELKKANKRFEELNRENYNETPQLQKYDIPKNLGSRIERKPRAASAVVKRLLISKKTWANYVDEVDKRELRMIKKLEVKTDKVRFKKLCTICGNVSFSSCLRCGSRVCSVKCSKTHLETRCSTF
ncbi:unnamed protein product [Ambrosiozyma monospora]|uniref:Unnamed protein product n=1 Tax=Ambrosiozyma monospora TaxID=43982 RepID=A0ACB5T6E0_AMBMO|nr:unnamed protein product [Ambrosiozyma monospora]